MIMTQMSFMGVTVGFLVHISEDQVFRCDVKTLAEWDVDDVKSVYDVYKMMSVAAYMAQLVKALVAKSEDLSLIPEIHIVEGQNQFCQDVL